MSTRSPSGPRDVRPAQRSTGEDYQGVETLLQAAMASGSSTSESNPDPECYMRDSSRAREDFSSTSPSPSTRRERYAGPRPPRPTYTQEQEDAIRFHRDDLSMSWTQVEAAYNNLTYADGRRWEKRTISGLQSRYYRLLPVPVNETKKMLKPRPELGILVKAPERKYWWMGGENSAEQRPLIRHNHASNGVESSGEDDDATDEDMDEDEEHDAQSPEAEQLHTIATTNKRKRKHAPLPTVTEAGRGPKKQRKDGAGRRSNKQAADPKNNITIQVTPASTFNTHNLDKNSSKRGNVNFEDSKQLKSESSPARRLKVTEFSSNLRGRKSDNKIPRPSQASSKSRLTGGSRRRDDSAEKTTTQENTNDVQ